jgi:Catalytic LigB subunit of aromatic ring-opening dioxygenase
MGEILGLGVTHQPTLGDEDFTPGSFRRTLADPELPEHLRDPSSWPELLRREWADDEGKAAGAAHQSAVEVEYRKITDALAAFDPDFIIVWGDDQYERFKENCVPTFCVIAADKFDIQPWEGQRKANLWGEDESYSMTLPGNRDAAKWLTGELLARDFDVSYSYESDEELSHAFVKTALYLDWARDGARFPMIPFAINCYGRLLTLTSGGRVPMSVLRGEGDFDPPAPSPRRCFDLGAAVAEIIAASDHRVALVASSSWSHGFLTTKNAFLFPDLESDRRLYRALENGDYDVWRAVTTDEVEASGQEEMLNWFCLAGAMHALGRTPDYISMVETALYNSNKVFAIYSGDA